MEMAFDLEKLKQSVLDGDAAGALELTRQALVENVPPEVLINQGLIPAMSVVGKLFEEGEIYIPEMVVASRAMQSCLENLKPLLSKTDIKPLAIIILGTVKGDLHDMGKNLVKMMLQGAGLEVVDLGTDVAPEKFIQAIQEHGAKLVGLSALLTTTMTSMRTTIETIEQSGLRDQVKIMVGGAPVTESFASQINADGYAPDASRAASLAKVLLGL
ncbi:MAG: corrinoid protein [Chloroflexi bacterium]|nr:corrinoid protein [Chloroflexota bacterium]